MIQSKYDESLVSYKSLTKAIKVGIVGTAVTEAKK